MKKLILSFLFLGSEIMLLHAQDFNHYEKKILINADDTLRYRILYPENFQSGKKYPVLIFLHGSGERGNDNEKQLAHGADLFLKPEVRSHFPAIIIFPQCPADLPWVNYQLNRNAADHSADFVFKYEEQPPSPLQMVKQLSDDLIASGVADPGKIFIGGLSMGAIATYDLLIRYPKYYAAAFTICGACDVDLMTKKGKKIPLWIFHGAKDDIVPPAYNRALYAALKNKNPDIRYTEYPEANHNSWDQAFAEPELLPWLFSFSK